MIQVIISGCFSAYNSATDGGFAYSFTCHFHMTNNNEIYNNSALNDGGAIFLVESVLDFFEGSSLIVNNTAGNKGGALHLVNSNIFLFLEPTIKFSNNMVTSVNGKGGAIFVLDCGDILLVPTKDVLCYTTRITSTHLTF